MDPIRHRQQPGRLASSNRTGTAIGWRALTILNAGIALVTIIALWFPRSSSAPQRTGRPVTHLQPERQRSLPNEVFRQSGSLPEDVMRMRVEDFASVPPSEYYEILLHAKPEEIAALAERFNELPVNSRSSAALGMFFQSWAELDGPAALAGAFRLGDKGFKRGAVSTVLHSMSAAVAPAATAFLMDHQDKSLPSDFYSDFVSTALSRWADLDPAAAAKFLDDAKLTNDPDVGSTRSAIAWSWGTIDPEGALDWINKPDNSDYTEGLFDSVLTGWSRNDPVSAMAYLAQHLDRPGAIEAAASVAVEVFNKDPNVAISWLGQLPASQARSNAEERIATLWTRQDPSAATAWAEQLPVGDMNGALYTVARILAVEDWPSTRDWLQRLTGEAHDVAVAGAVAYTSVPASETLPVALSINNSESRIHVVENIVTNWAVTDREAAANWVRSSGLTRQEKQDLLQLDVFTQKYQP